MKHYYNLRTVFYFNFKM